MTPTCDSQLPVLVGAPLAVVTDIEEGLYVDLQMASPKRPLRVTCRPHRRDAIASQATQLYRSVQDTCQDRPDGQSFSLWA